VNAIMISIEPYKPTKTKRTFEEISNKIKELIFTGALKPGEKLPSENQLAKKLKVGRQSVREALRLLEISGFITIQKGVNGGPVIQNTMLNKMAGMFLDTYKFNRIPIKDLTVARVEIGKQILRLAIDNATETNIRNLLKNVRKAKNKQKNNLPAFEENINFHRLLAKASKNHVFVMVMESLMAVESDFRSRFQQIDLAKSIEITKLHENMLQAIINGDYHLAQGVLETLIHMVHKMYKSYVPS